MDSVSIVLRNYSKTNKYLCRLCSCRNPEKQNEGFGGGATGAGAGMGQQGFGGMGQQFGGFGGGFGGDQGGAGGGDNTNMMNALGGGQGGFPMMNAGLMGGMMGGGMMGGMLL